jgi:hypothetical protein
MWLQHTKNHHLQRQNMRGEFVWLQHRQNMRGEFAWLQHPSYFVYAAVIQTLPSYFISGGDSSWYAAVPNSPLIFWLWRW